VSLLDIATALAAALAPIGDTIDGLQVTPFLNGNPTPPSIDIYPGTPFQAGSGYGGDDLNVYFTIRARTTFADSVAGQQGLYQLLDAGGPESVRARLEEDQTLGGVVQSLWVVDDAVSGFTEYVEDSQTGGRLVGCEWRVMVIT
jgi:hypothetical protein